MPTRFAPEPDLLHVIDLAVISHTIGTTIDPRALLADLLQLDGDDLAEWLDHYRDARDLDVPAAVPPFHHTAAIPADITPDQPVDQHSPQLAALQRVIVAARWWERRGEVAMPVQEVLTLADADNLQPGDQWTGGITTTTNHCADCDSVAADQLSESRARVRDGLRWRVAEAGSVAHWVVSGRGPLCGSSDVGPWRVVAGAARCGACDAGVLAL